MTLPPSPSINKLFSTPESFWTTARKGSSTKCFGTVRLNNFDRIPWIPAPLFFPNFFRHTKLVKPYKIPLRVFSALWDKNFITRNCDMTLWGINFFDPRNKRHTKGLLHENFRLCETKNFCRRIVTLPPPPPLIHKVFRYPKLSKSQKGSSMKCFDTLRQNNFDRKSWFFPPSFIPNNFRYTKLVKP